MSAAPHRAALALATGVLAVSAPLAAQSRPIDRVDLAARYGRLTPAGGSQLYTLLDRALDAGGASLRPRLVGGELRARVVRHWSVVAGAETGRSTLASTSRVRPLAATGDVRQQTALDVPSLAYGGIDWQAVRWHVGGAERVRVVVGAGGGVARYRLHQWGDFVDADRRVAFADDFRSTGHGAIAYGHVAVQAPLRAWVALEADARRQWGSAPMTGDFAEFDRLDLGGTRLGAGVVLHPGGLSRRR